MAKLLHHVTIEVFSKAHDSIATAYRGFDVFAPVPMEQVLERQWHWHEEKDNTKIYDLKKEGVSFWEVETPGNDGTMSVLTYRFTKQRDTKAFVEKLQTLPRKERIGILKNIEGNLDAEGKLKLRFDKAALAEGKLVLGGKGEKVMTRLNLAAYPKNWDTCLAVAREIFDHE